MMLLGLWSPNNAHCVVRVRREGECPSQNLIVHVILEGGKSQQEFAYNFRFFLKIVFYYIKIQA